MTLTDSKLNVTTVTSPNGVDMSDGGRDGVRGAVWSHVAVKWCGDATRVNDQQITDNDAAIQKQHNTAFRKDRRRNKNQKKDKITSCFLSRPQRVLLWSGLLQRSGGGGLNMVDMLAKTLCCALSLSLDTEQSPNTTEPNGWTIWSIFLFIFWFAYLCSFPSGFDFYESQSCSIWMCLIAVWNDFWDTVSHLGWESVTADQFIFYLLLFNLANRSPSTFYRLSSCHCLIDRTAPLWGA